LEFNAFKVFSCLFTFQIAVYNLKLRKYRTYLQTLFSIKSKCNAKFLQPRSHARTERALEIRLNFSEIVTSASVRQFANQSLALSEFLEPTHPKGHPNVKFIMAARCTSEGGSEVVFGEI